MNLQAFGQGQSLDTELTGFDTKNLPHGFKSAEKKKWRFLISLICRATAMSSANILAEQLNLDFVMG